MSVMASRIAGVSSVRSTVCSGADKKNTKALRHCEENSPVTGGFHPHRPVDSLHKGPSNQVTQKMFPFDHVDGDRIC